MRIIACYGLLSRALGVVYRARVSHHSKKTLVTREESKVAIVYLLKTPKDTIATGGQKHIGCFSGLTRRRFSEPRPHTDRGAETQNRTEDTAIFSRVLYQLSYLG